MIKQILLKGFDGVIKRFNLEVTSTEPVPCVEPRMVKNGSRRFSQTFVSASALRISRVEATLSTRRKRVVARRRAGNTLKSNARTM